jgi:repressor LexA
VRPLSARQLELLTTLRAFGETEGRMPSVRELAARLGRAPSTVQQHLDALAKKGFLERDGSAHGLRLAGANPPRRDGATVDVPVRGTIAAGAPIEALETMDDFVSLPVSLAPAGSYALNVRGDSMVGDHILDGDLVIVRPQDQVEAGEIAVALLPDGTATLKRVYREAGGIRLQPANPAMAPQRVPAVQVQGKVVGVLRRFG